MYATMFERSVEHTARNHVHKCAVLHTDHCTHKQRKSDCKPSRKNAKSGGCMRSMQPLRRRKV